MLMILHCIFHTNIDWIVPYMYCAFLSTYYCNIFLILQGLLHMMFEFKIIVFFHTGNTVTVP